MMLSTLSSSKTRKLINFTYWKKITDKSNKYINSLKYLICVKRTGWWIQYWKPISSLQLCTIYHHWLHRQSIIVGNRMMHKLKPWLVSKKNEVKIHVTSEKLCFSFSSIIFNSNCSFRHKWCIFNFLGFNINSIIIFQCW